MSAHICIIAGEASGDFLGSRLMSALHARQNDAVFTGIGGPLMTGEGMKSLFPYEELSVMGITEVLPKIPALLARIRQAVDHIVETKPDVVVTIDSPDFSFRVAKDVRKRMGADAPKLIHYVAPTVWAWREGRAAKISKFLDGLICLFDFEPPYFERHGLRSAAVGHPMVEGVAGAADAVHFREEYAIGLKEPVIGILFGSRRGEIKRTGRILRDAAFRLAANAGGNVHIVAPTLPHMQEGVFALLKDYHGPIHIVTDPADKYNAFKAMDVALAVSGTVGLELAYLQVPHVIGYRANAMTAWMIKRLIKVKYAHLANIMAGHEIVPEFLQERCEAGIMSETALEILLNPSAQKTAMADIGARLGAEQKETPSQKAAAFVLSFL